MDEIFNYVIHDSFELKPDVRELVDFDRSIAIRLKENEVKALIMLSENSPDAVENEELQAELSGSDINVEEIISRLRKMLRDEEGQMIRGNTQEGYRIESVKKLAVSHNITGFSWPQTFLKRAFIAMLIFIIAIVLYILIWGK